VVLAYRKGIPLRCIAHTLRRRFNGVSRYWRTNQERGAEHLLNVKTRRPGKAADETVRAFYERTQRGDPQRKKIALAATAHYLVRVMWAMLSHGNTWQENQSRAA
jgi:hypothetical protein